jgi:hypothetical protein
LTERYTEETDRDPDDFRVELGDTEFLQLNPTDEYDPDELLLDETGWIEFNGFDATNPDEVRQINQARLDNDFGNVFIPDGLTVEEVVPEGTEVVIDTDAADDNDVTAFGQGVEAEEQEVVTV